MPVRIRGVSLTALAALAALAMAAGTAHAQSGYLRPNPAAAKAARQAYEAEAAALDRPSERRARQRETTRDPYYDDTGTLEALDPLEGFEDPLDEIDDYGEVDDLGDLDTRIGSPEGLPDHGDPDGIDAPDVPDPMDDMDTLSGFDVDADREHRDDRRDSLAREIYRAAERGLDDPSAAGAAGGGLDLPDAGLGLDPFVEP